MRKIMKYIVLTVIWAVLASCSTVSKEIKTKAHGEKVDVFREVKEWEVVPQGFADLMIKASIKTHLEGHYLLELKKTFHGKPGYPFLINLGGQATTWKVDGQQEVMPDYDKKGRRNPERGEGMKYILEKRIRLKSGSHKIFFGLPSENYFKEIEITLKDRHQHILEFKPIYRTSRRNVPGFLSGVKEFEVFLDGIAVGQQP
jgi:hypothetical protein